MLIRIATIAIATCLVLLISAAYIDARLEQNRVGKLIRILAYATPGTTSRASIRQMLQRESFNTGDSNACAKYHMGDCDQFGFENRWIAFLHLAPVKAILVTVEYKDGIVISKTVLFLEEPHLAVTTKQFFNADETQTTDVVPESRQVTVDAFNDRSESIKVNDDQNVDKNRRAKDWLVDASCFSRFGACTDLRVVLPGAFPKP
jgi:hypothetical protein